MSRTENIHLNPRHYQTKDSFLVSQSERDCKWTSAALHVGLNPQF